MLLRKASSNLIVKSGWKDAIERKVNLMGARLRNQSIAYKVGWWVLVVIAAASVVNHTSGPLLGFASGDDEVLAFFGIAAMNTYALVVLLASYRRGERWAWWVTWVFIAIYGLVILYAPVVGPLGAAVVMTFAQLLTLAAFRQPDQVVSTG